MKTIPDAYARARFATRTRYVSALCIVALVAAAQFVVLAAQLADQRQQAQVVNVAGRQSMLAEQIADLSGQWVDAVDPAQRKVYRAWLREDAAELGRNARRLASGERSLNPSGWPPEEVRRLFASGTFDVANKTRIFAAHASALADAPARTLLPLNADLWYVRDMSPSLVFSYGTIVDKYVASSVRQHERLLWYEALGLAALLLTLVLEVPFIFEPMQYAIDRVHRNLLRESKDLARAQRTAHLGSWERDLRSGDTAWSAEMRRMAGLSDADAPPPFGALNHPSDAAGVAAAVERAERTRTPYSIDHRIVTGGGETRWIQQQGEFSYAADGTPTLMSGTVFDITERMRADESARHAASHDAVTGLPNRLLLEDRLLQALGRARRKASIVALMHVTLDRFEPLVEALGHTAGDRTLRAAAQRLGGCLREIDTVARIAENRFAVVLSDLTDAGAATTIAKKVVAALAQPYTFDEHEMYATPSIGISLYPLDASDVESLIRGAEAATSQAKQTPGGSYYFNTAKAHTDGSAQLALERDLRHALERREFVLHYQPIVRASGRIAGVEALLRWEHPGSGLMAPDMFIPLAEETGLIVPIGDWVLRTACAQLQAWHNSAFPDVRLAVNISGVQFRNPDFVERVREALVQTAFPAGRLELEITESVVMSDVTRTLETLQQLKAMGVHLAIDDFGTGYSSLSYLKQFPVDTLKIDRSFVRDLPANAGDAAIVRAIVAFARSLTLRTVAEGVETHAQLEYLRDAQCDELQGYYFSRAIAPEAVKRWILADVQAVGSE